MVREQSLIKRDEQFLVEPEEIITVASRQAAILMSIVEQTKCYQDIRGKKYLQVEAWETIGAFNRTHAITQAIVPIIKEGETIGYEANVGLVKNGQSVGGAIMPCFFTENACKGKDGDAKHKACMSAAQTFATSKAYRMNFSYVAILAGYQPTPAEEMTGEATDERLASLEHWCEEHKTKFFKSGKMKGYAHPIAGTKEWCYEKNIRAVPPVRRLSETSVGTPSTPNSDNSSGIEAESNRELSESLETTLKNEVQSNIDPAWLDETLRIIRWSEKTALSWIRAQLKLQVPSDDNLADVLDRLDKDKLKRFFDHIQAMREASGQ